MTRKRRLAPEDRAAVTLERFVRFLRLLTLLTEGPQTRAVLLRRLRVDLRGFYRDLEALRALGVTIRPAEGQYTLSGPADGALERLPFPDPRLTLGEARQLARGRTAAHRRLREILDRLAP